MSAANKTGYFGTAIVSGALFGAGLYISQMVDPLKVLRFLDFSAIPAGGWDPSLALVIVSALVVMFAAVRIGDRRKAPLFDTEFHRPEYTRIDGRLIGGATLFGIGWGMSGICPGPALSLIAFLPDNLWVFLLAMFAGTYLGSFAMPRSRTPRLAPAE